MTDSLKIFVPNPVLLSIENAYRARVSSYDRLSQLSEDVIYEILTAPTEYGKDGNASIKAELAFKVHRLHVAEQPKHNINQNLSDSQNGQDLPPPVFVTREEALGRLANVVRLEKETFDWKDKRIAEKEAKSGERQSISINTTALVSV